MALTLRQIHKFVNTPHAFLTAQIVLYTFTTRDGQIGAQTPVYVYTDRGVERGGDADAGQ
jgi:hypothetical protein